MLGLASRPSDCSWSWSFINKQVAVRFSSVGFGFHHDVDTLIRRYVAYCVVAYCQVKRGRRVRFVVRSFGTQTHRGFAQEKNCGLHIWEKHDEGMRLAVSRFVGVTYDI